MPDPENQLMQARLEKLRSLRANGIDPYPHRYDRTHTSNEALRLLERSEAERLGEGEAQTDAVSVAGRIVRYRRMGRASFADIQDGHGSIQLLFRRNNLADTYETLKALDIGDWIGAAGPVFRTRTGEPTVEVKRWAMLSKSIRSLPEKWHGLNDVEARFRQRYLDLIVNEGARGAAVMRSRMIRAVRRFMDARGFMEVETPILVQVPAGGAARPFSTRHNALQRDLYLRIATELHLKQLIVGGIEKVYEIGRVFRNEGVDSTHNPEFTTMESYEAFADYTDVMDMVERLVFTAAQEALGSAMIEFDGSTIDLTPPWPRLDLRQEVMRQSGIDFLEANDIDSLKSEMTAIGLDPGRQMSWGGLLDKLLSDTVEPGLMQPTFLVDTQSRCPRLPRRSQMIPGWWNGSRGSSAAWRYATPSPS